jgi:hypothetical protein
MVVANPRLLEAPCNRIEQMRLVKRRRLAGVLYQRLPKLFGDLALARRSARRYRAPASRPPPPSTAWPA